MPSQPKISLVINFDETRAENDSYKELLRVFDGPYLFKRDALSVLLPDGTTYYEGGGRRFDEPLKGIITGTHYLAHKNEFELDLEVPAEHFNEDLVEYLRNPANGWVVESDG